jgi:GxxExxY protein
LGAVFLNRRDRGGRGDIKMIFENINQLTDKLIGLAIKVHRQLGPGFLESVYQAALAYEFEKNGIEFYKEKDLPIFYENERLNVGFRCDFLIEDKVILECKAVRKLTKIDEAQLLNYLKATKLTVGLLINFNTLVLKDGVKRMVNNFIN